MARFGKVSSGGLRRATVLGYILNTVFISFTGNRQRDQQMLAAQPSLQPTYQQAIQERQQLALKFNQMPK
jgi:hypothetical protein